MGVEIFGNEETRMDTVIPFMVPEGLNEEEVRMFLLNNFSIELAGSFGELQGQVIRIGNMGYSSNKVNVLNILAALETTIDFLKNKSSTRGQMAALEMYM